MVLLGDVFPQESTDLAGHLFQQLVILRVGGFLGLGDHKVIMRWDDLRMTRDGDRLVVVTSATRDKLRSMPAYK